MNTKMKLLGQLLAQQEPKGDETLDDPDYWRRRLSEAKPLSMAEVSAIWTEPETRDAFYEAREDRLHQARQSWTDSAYDAPSQLMAASSDTQFRNIKGPGYDGVLIAPKREGRSWIISLELTAQLLDQTPAWARLRLFDDGGRTWLVGRPENGSNVLEGRWDYDDESPVNRLINHTISLELA